MCVRTINEKEGMNLKKIKGGMWEGMNGGNSSRNDIIML